MGRVVWLSLVGIAVAFLLIGIAIGDSIGKKAATASSTTTTTLAPIGTTTATPTTKAPVKAKPKVVFSTSGSGDTSTGAFTVTHQPWALYWSFNCADFGGTGNFGIDIRMGDNDDINDEGPNVLAKQGHSTAHYFDTGTFNLQILSECRWRVKATD